MSAFTKFITRAPETIFPEGRFQEIRATAPNQGIYNIEATRDLVKNQPAIFSPFAPTAAATMSIPYDTTQGIMRARDKFFDANPTSFGITDDTGVPIGPSLSDVAAAIDAENPISSAIERTKGATLGLRDRLVKAPEFLSNLIFTPLGADSDIVPTKPEDDLMNYDEFYDMPEEKERKNLLERILEFAPFVGEKSLTGILTNALGGAKNRLTDFRDAIGRRLGPAPFGTSQAAFNALTPSQQQSVASIYGQGGIMQGYNPVSAFGRGPGGAIENRIANILGRKAPQTAASRAKVKQLQQALTDIGGGDSGSSFDSDTGGTFGSSVDDASTFSDYS